MAALKNELVSSEALNLVRGANIEISGFLAEYSPLFPAKEGTRVPLPEIQQQLAAIYEAIRNVGRFLGKPPSLENLDAVSMAQINLYAGNLERLKSFLINLQTYAETWRDHLTADSRKISEVLAWCNALKLTASE